MENNGNAFVYAGCALDCLSIAMHDIVEML